MSLSSIFPSIDPDFADALMKENDNSIETCVQKLLELGDEYPKKSIVPVSSPDTFSKNFKDFSAPVSSLHKRLCCGYVSTHYSFYPLDMLIRESSAFKFHLFPTIMSLEKNIRIDDENHSVLFFKDKLFHRLPYQRTNPQLQKLEQDYDQDFGKEVKLVEDYIKKRNEKAVRREIGLLEGEDFIHCPVCGGFYTIDEFLQCSECCLVCEECLNKHFVSMVNSKKVSAKCIGRSGCRGEYTEPFIKVILKYDPDIKAEYDRLLNAQVMASLEQATVECPLCGYFCAKPGTEEKRGGGGGEGGGGGAYWKKGKSKGKKTEMAASTVSVGENLLVCENSKCGKTSCLECKQERVNCICLPLLDDISHRDVTDISSGLSKFLTADVQHRRNANQLKTLYHATLSAYAKMIRDGNFFKSSGPNNDIGPGIYLADDAQSAHSLADGAKNHPDVYFECLVDVGETIMSQNAGDVKLWQSLHIGRYGSIYAAPQWAIRDNAQILKFVLKHY